MKVVSYTPNATEAVLAANQFNDPPVEGKQYALVGLELSYVDGKEEKDTPGLVTIKAVGPSNTSYSWSDASVVPPDSLEGFKDVFKGGSVSGNRAFAVAAADADQLVLYAQAGFSHDEVYFATNAEQGAGTPPTAAAAAPTPTTTASAPGAAGTRSSPIPLNTAAAIGDGWTMKVVSYTANATDAVLAANRFNDPPPDGKQYALVGLELSYLDGKDDKALPALVSIKAVGSSNTSYSWSDAFVVAPNSLDSTKDVFKGGTVSGNHAFAVLAADADQLVLYAQAGFGRDDVYFATQPR